MNNRCPAIHQYAIVGDDAFLVAGLSAALARKGKYLPVMDAPSNHWTTADSDSTRRRNALARMKCHRVVLANLAPEADLAMSRGVSDQVVIRAKSLIDVASLAEKKSAALKWGKNKIGLGLLHALRAGSGLTFDGESDPAPIEPIADHLVVCEEGDDIAQIVAANYAFSIGAGLCLIPHVARGEAEKILERFYSCTEDRNRAPGDILRELRTELRLRVEQHISANCRSITFFTGMLPWGYAFTEKPSTHVFLYPDVGLCVLHGLLSEQPGTPGIQVAAIIDPGTVQATEVKVAVDSLSRRGAFINCLFGNHANVRNVSNTVELYPYDFLLISTHCGDDEGWRWTYEFKGGDGLSHTMVVDVAAGFSVTPGQKKIAVTEHMRFGGIL